MKREPISRRQAITETVKAFVKNKPYEYQSVLDEIKLKRAKMPRNSWGESTDGIKLDGEIIFSLKVPSNMLAAIDQILSFHQQARLFELKDKEESDKEYKWFKENFPQFVVPEFNKRIF